MTKRYVLDEGLSVEKPGEGSAKWQKLFPVNVTKHRGDFPGGRIDFTTTMLGVMAANARAVLAKGHQIQVNYHHLGGNDVAASAPLESTVAAGWIKDVQDRADGLWALMEWTERARKFIEANELKYLSPEFALEYANRDTGKKQGPTLLGAALTNTPFLKELPRVAATDASQADEATTGVKRMDKKLICAALGLSEDTADEAVLAKMTELAQVPVKLTDAGVKLTEATAKVTTLSEQVTALSAENLSLKAEKEKAQEEKQKVEVKVFFDGLVTAGRISPAERAGLEPLALKSGVEQFRFYEKLEKKKVDLTEHGTDGAPPPESVKLAEMQKKLDERVAAIRKQDEKLTFVQAHDLAMSEMPTVRDQLYGPPAKANA